VEFAEFDDVGDVGGPADGELVGDGLAEEFAVVPGPVGFAALAGLPGAIAQAASAGPGPTGHSVAATSQYAGASNWSARSPGVVFSLIALLSS
jgi:hypothetical protein